MTGAPKILSSFLHLFYPHVCCGCGTDAIQEQDLLCLYCTSQLPHTGYAELHGNPIEKIFWGRLPIQCAMSEFYFSKGSIVQSLLHELKYRSNKEIGVMMGKMIGETLLTCGRFLHIDALIPIPLSKKKEFRRGYNQSQIICEGIASAINIPLITNNVIRKQSTDTQTKKNRRKRWENVQGSFFVTSPAALENKHVLLVDDIITTGATIEACGSVLAQIPNITISIATVAYASI